MFTTWTSANRIVSKPLETRFTREAFIINGGPQIVNYAKSYWLYKRIRTKTYRYVGLADKATADACVAAMNLLYNRKIPNGWLYSAESSVTEKWKPYYLHANAPIRWAFKQCGNAVAKLELGGRYTVDVEVDEELETRYDMFNSDLVQNLDETSVYRSWTAFEANPDIATTRFSLGIETQSGSDFSYDEET